MKSGAILRIKLQLANKINAYQSENRRNTGDQTYRLNYILENLIGAIYHRIITLLLLLLIGIMATSFRIESTIRGHHVFKEIWTPHINENLEVTADHGNVFDIHSVAAWKGGQVVGHVPRELLSPQKEQ